MHRLSDRADDSKPAAGRETAGRSDAIICSGRLFALFIASSGRAGPEGVPEQFRLGDLWTPIRNIPAGAA
jgi:hypothetical protein